MVNGTLRRRLRTIPAFTVALVLLVALAPLLLPLIVLVDAIRWSVQRRHWMGIRLYLFGVVYRAAEAVGLLALGVVWLAAGFGRFRRPLLDWTFAIQLAWAGTLLAAVRGIFGMRFEVVGEDVISPGPILLLARHASIGDHARSCRWGTSIRSRRPRRLVQGLTNPVPASISDSMCQLLTLERV